MKSSLVVQKSFTDDPAQGVWSVPEAAQWSLWCDASDIAHGAVIQADGMIVEDGCWLRQEDDRRHIKGEVYPKIKFSPVVVFGVLSRMVLVRGS